MEMTQKEMELAQELDNQSREQPMLELADLQLAFIGGGSTVDSFH